MLLLLAPTLMGKSGQMVGATKGLEFDIGDQGFHLIYWIFFVTTAFSSPEPVIWWGPHPSYCDAKSENTPIVVVFEEHTVSVLMSFRNEASLLSCMFYVELNNEPALYVWKEEYIIWQWIWARCRRLTPFSPFLVRTLSAVTMLFSARHVLSSPASI